jgi:predicted protein tyrosine phosphatase
MQLKITEYGVAKRLLETPSLREDIKYVVGIGCNDDPNQKVYEGFKKFEGPKLWLDFWDIETSQQSATWGVQGPTKADIKQLIDFAKTLDLEQEGTLLVHCFAGISRSTAAAYIIYCIKYGPGREHDAMKEVFNVRWQADPNRWMLEIASRLLGRDIVKTISEAMRVKC